MGNSAGVGVWEPARRRLTVALLLVVSAGAFEALAVATALPAAVGDLGGLRAYGWAFSAFMLANLVALPAAGRAADLHGVHRPFAVGGALFAVGLTLAGFAPAMPVFLAARVLQGLGAGALSAAAYAAVARVYPEASRPRMLALLSSAWVVPGLIGPAAAAALTAAFGWRSVFLAVLPFTLVATWLGLPAMRRLEGGAPAAERPGRTAAALQLALGVGLLLAAPEAPSRVAAAAAVLAGATIAWPALQRVLPEGVLRASGPLPAAVATIGALSAAFFGAEVFVPLAVTEVRERSTWLAGAVLTAATLAWTAGSWLQERWVGRHSSRNLARLGVVLVAAGIAGMAGVLFAAVPIVLAPIAWGVSGLGMGIAYPTVTLIAFAAAPEGGEGETSSAVQLATVLGTALGTGLCGGLLALALDAGYPVAAGIAAADALALAAGAGSFVAARALGRSADAPSSAKRRRDGRERGST